MEKMSTTTLLLRTWWESVRITCMKLDLRIATVMMMTQTEKTILRMTILMSALAMKILTMIMMTLPSKK